MKTFNATNTAYFKNKIEGKSTLDQISAVTSIVDIIGDVFAFNYDSRKFLEGSKENRFDLNCLRTSYHWFSIGLLKSLIDSASTGQDFDWSKVHFSNDVRELSEDFQEYHKSTLGTLSIFDWFFAHDSMKGEFTDHFRWTCAEIRDFFLVLLADALEINPTKAIEEGTVIYPNCDEPGPDAEIVYQ